MEKLIRRGTTFINCSVVNENYNVVNKPVEFEIADKSPWNKEWDGFLKGVTAE